MGSDAGFLLWGLFQLAILASLAAAVVATVVAVSRGPRRIGSHAFESLEQLFADLERHLGPGVRVQGSLSLRRTELRVPIGGRKARVTFFWGGLAYYVRFELDMDKAPRVSMSRTGAHTRTLTASGLPASAEGLGLEDLPFTFATLDRPKVERAFAGNPAIRGELVALFAQHPFDSVRVWGGKLTATAPLRAVQPEDFRPLLERLARVASAFERVPLPVRVLGGERRALRGASGGARCAYCHDGITGDEPDLVACDRCHTVLHDGCWAELMRCPVLGCDGHDPERPGERFAERAREEG